jgi:hypothetical protein
MLRSSIHRRGTSSILRYPLICGWALLLGCGEVDPAPEQANEDDGICYRAYECTFEGAFCRADFSECSCLADESAPNRCEDVCPCFSFEED